MNSAQKKIQVEIWSDVMCPFCYIGKRKFETALAQFPGKDNVEITWKSFQLSPDMKTDPGKSSDQYLSEHKGISLEESRRLHDHVTQLAKQVGLVYNFNKAITANSFNAHRFTHFAKEHAKQHEAEELLFRAYFTEGKNIDDHATLMQLGKEIGLDKVSLQTALTNNTYADVVHTDIEEARKIGVRGVPFFLFNRKYAISGAQDSAVFLQALEKIAAE